jgi:hypothetical protein
MEFFQVMNALMMKEIFSPRSSIMRRNAQLFDWFIQNHSSPSVINMNQVSIPVNQHQTQGQVLITPLQLVLCFIVYHFLFHQPTAHLFRCCIFHLGPVWIPKFSPWIN